MRSNIPRRRYAPGLLFSLAALFFATATAAEGPSPELSPTQVVRMQLRALRSDAVDQGIARAYRFASPGNRRSVGGLEAFTQMLKQRYADMLTATGATVTLKKRSGTRAQVLAQLDQVGGRQTAYIFVLARQRRGDCKGCWMTEGVVALKPDASRALHTI